MRISELKLGNFCGFSSFRLPLSEFNILVGPNNGGKTTILRAIRMMFDAMELSVAKYATEVRKWKEAADQLVKRHREMQEQVANSSHPSGGGMMSAPMSSLKAQFQSEQDEHNRRFPKWQSGRESPPLQHITNIMLRNTVFRSTADIEGK